MKLIIAEKNDAARQIAERLDRHLLLNLCQCRLTLLTAFIVLRITQATLFITACDHNLRTVQLNRSIFIRKICRIQKDCMILFAHCDRKLIHDPTIHTVEFILRKLADQRQILICHIKAKEIP